MGTNPLASVLKGPLSGLLSFSGDLIEKLTTTETERNEARAALLEIERQANADILAADAAFAKAQSAVIVAEAQSKSKIARMWRPLTMLTFTFIIFYNYIASPLFGAPRVEIPPDMWDVIKLGLTGYVAGRSLEKIAPSVADVFKIGKK